MRQALFHPFSGCSTILPLDFNRTNVFDSNAFTMTSRGWAAVQLRFDPFALRLLKLTVPLGLLIL
jgi:hypothetical protein